MHEKQRRWTENPANSLDVKEWPITLRTRLGCFAYLVEKRITALLSRRRNCMVIGFVLGAAVGFAAALFL